MRKLLTAVIFVASLCGVASRAQAEGGWVIEGSVGKGGRVNEPRGWEPTNVMGTFGYQFLYIRPELGLVGALGDVKNSKFDLQLRPMIGIYPPIIPIYARAIFAVENVLHRPVRYSVGGAAGLKIGLPFVGVSVFAEAGALPRFVDSTTQWVVEGRIGAFWVL